MVENVGAWLEAVRDHIQRVAPPALQAVASDYLGEAHFGASLIAADLAVLPRDARLLEVGAGMMLLSGALQASGYRVTALEPTGSGFSHLDQLRQVALAYAAARGSAPEVQLVRAEQLDADGRFDYAFSINVMEHVDDVAAVLRRIWSALRPGGSYRFVCPNYLFPYEPHFGIPTLFTKSLTAAVFRRWILGSRTVVDPAGTWASLNWISVPAVRRMSRRELGVTPEFDRALFSRYVRRAIDDPSFRRRHGSLMHRACAALDRTGLTSALARLPASVQPAMSCRLVRPDACV